ncbi:MAG: CbtB-domain containing protein [Verrucomicrobiota bacterium]
MSQSSNLVLDSSLSIPRPTPIPFKILAPWLVFGGLLMLLLIYLVGAEQGATSIFSGMYVHEWVHDGRHLLGFPCH